ncbi:MAG: UvrB/UvrC motif-containing protein [Candidatus Pacebacteria bacterium]|nr:UvrB/UvrC motif-containing protein [Candidatus Paceibacterota bacterium]
MEIRQKIKKLPDNSGIYLFYRGRELIYVGKATSLKKRVASYFSGIKNFRPIEFMINEVDNVKHIETDSVIEAIILEANYIKKFQPKYNVKEKDDKSWNYLIITKDDFPHLEVAREHTLKEIKAKKYKYLFGPFPSIKTSQMLKILHNLFFVSRCLPNQKRPCFDYQIGHCLGVCTGEISKIEYQNRVVKPLAYFLSGKKKTMLLSLERQMKQLSREQRFENAKHIRDQINSLKRIRDVALLNKSFLESSFEEELNEKKFKVKRIEGYDISNLGIDAKVGSMVVFNSKQPIKAEYKKFKIKTVIGQSDVDCLKEVLERRLKNKDWILPEIILVDGGKPQVNTVRKALSSVKLSIPIVGIAKGIDRNKDEFICNSNDKNFLNWVDANNNLLIRVRDEAHRFAISYQRQVLRKNKIK